ncbi:hypothetical protein H4R18_005564 [Coemansia javaensis]|uniref:Uncharacterized protein n=1 Tax=Coemansia javaensis TaxID=2761396 RepID=A0A9W8H2S4_9FUNG|nr:hypothetical protein H4R18_005564 [Coemansia javaensis]
MSAVVELVQRRSIKLGPEDPSATLYEAYDIVNRQAWKQNLALGLTGAGSGAMMVFLFVVFIWRRSLVNRVSLRLIFAISMFDFTQCMIQLHNGTPPLPGCRALSFFIDFFMYASIYLSASIAFNLQMTFLTKPRKPLPGYVEYFYYAVPMLVTLLQFAPQYIWAAKHGYCSAFEPIMPGTRAFLVYILLAGMGVMTLVVLYNVVVSAAVIITLYLKQRRISQVLVSAMCTTNEILGGPQDPCAPVADPALSDRPRITPKEKRQLTAMRKVYRACIRIALYPLAPVTYWTIGMVFYVWQYFITLTWKSDVDKTVRVITLGRYMPCVVVLTNFIIFLTDPAVLHVAAEVRKSLAARFGSSKRRSVGAAHGFKPDRHEKAGVTITESTKADGPAGINASVDSSDLEVPGLPAGDGTSASSTLKRSQSFTSFISDLHNDAVAHRVRDDSNVRSFLDSM